MWCTGYFIFKLLHGKQQVISIVWQDLKQKKTLLCSIIIDRGNNEKLVSEDALEKMRLPIESHPNSYKPTINHVFGKEMRYQLLLMLS
ncbi:hypothetical protein ACLOJK_008438 [Asimina triloba]